MGFTDNDRILRENLFIFKGYGPKNLLKSFQVKVGPHWTNYWIIWINADWSAPSWNYSVL